MLADSGLGLFFIGVPEGEGKIVLEMEKIDLQLAQTSEDCDDVALLNFYLSNTNSKSRSPPTISEYERSRQNAVGYIEYLRELIKKQENARLREHIKVCEAYFKIVKQYQF